MPSDGSADDYHRRGFEDTLVFDVGSIRIKDNTLSCFELPTRTELRLLYRSLVTALNNALHSSKSTLTSERGIGESDEMLTPEEAISRLSMRGSMDRLVDAAKPDAADHSNLSLLAGKLEEYSLLRLKCFPTDGNAFLINAQSIAFRGGTPETFYSHLEASMWAAPYERSVQLRRLEFAASATVELEMDLSSLIVSDIFSLAQELTPPQYADLYASLPERMRMFAANAYRNQPRTRILQFVEALNRLGITIKWE